MHSSLKHSFTNIRGFCSSFDGCGSFLESNSPNFLVLCDTNLDGSIGSTNFSVRGYLLLIQKSSVTHTHSLIVEGGASFCMGLISRKLYGFLFVFSNGFALFVVLLLFPPLITVFVFVHSFSYHFIQHRWGSLKESIC